MDCPHCHAPDQQDRYCTKCGAMLTPEASTDLSKESSPRPPSKEGPKDASFGQSLLERLRSLPPKHVILFLAGACSMLLIVCVVLLLSKGGNTFDPQGPVVVTNQSQPESEAVKALRKAPVLTPEEGLAQDAIVGHWQHYSESGVIEKVGKDKYRWLIGNRTFLVTFAQDHYDVTPEEETYYQFVFDGPDELVLQSSRTVSGKAVKNPAFASGYALSRLDQDGQPAGHKGVNEDAFNIVGKTYGQLAGLYGPGSLTVISGEQYVVFRGDGGNFAVSFVGSTVPLAAAPHPWQAVPLEGDGLSSYQLLPLTNNDAAPSGDHQGEGAEPPKNQGPPAPASEAPREDKHDSATNDETQPLPVEVPNPATFPSVSAVAHGVVWADLGFVINDCPRTIGLDRLAKLMNVKFETGSGTESASGFSFYGAKDGYFAATYRQGDRKYKVSGYGRTLDRSKTMIFIEPLN